MERTVPGSGNRFLAHDSADEGDEINKMLSFSIEKVSTSVCVFSYPIHCLTKKPMSARELQR